MFKKILICFFMCVSFFSYSKVKSEFVVYCPNQNITFDTAHIFWTSMKDFSSKVCDYKIILNGKTLALSAIENSKKTNPTAYEYKNAFYSHYTKKLTSLEMIQIDTNFYTLDNLKSETEYSVEVVAVDKKGKTIFKSLPFTFKTKAKGDILDVTDYGAVSSEKICETLNLNGEKDLILKNTQAIQKAIDSCPKDGIIYIPNGIFMCGGLDLKSDMTIKIDGVLCSSPFAEHYRFGFLMYEYYTDNRYYGLLNANGVKNLTITGSGTIDGNGWLFADERGQPSLSWQVYSEEGDVDFNKINSPARKLVRYIKSNNKKIYEHGILAKNCAKNYLSSINKTVDTATKEELAQAYATRSTTLILKNVEGLLISQLLFLNPANHMINIIDSKNITVTAITELTYDANNGDGIGLICSTDAFIFNNFIDTGDDSIVFSAGVGKSAFLTGQSFAGNTEIFGNYIHHGHGGVAFGSHTALGLKNIKVKNNIFNHTDAPFRIKSAPANGGEVCNILFENNCLANVKQAFIMSTDYNDAGTVTKYGAADKPAVFHDIICRNCTVYRVNGTTFYVSAKDGYNHYNILFENIIFKKPGNLGQFIQNADVKFK